MLICFAIYADLQVEVKKTNLYFVQCITKNTDLVNDYKRRRRLRSVEH